MLRKKFLMHLYVKDTNLNGHVQMFKTTIRANCEMEDEDIVNMFIIALHNIISLQNYNFFAKHFNCTFAKLKPLITLVNMVVIITRNRIMEKHVFQEREPLKNKIFVDWIEE